MSEGTIRQAARVIESVTGLTYGAWECVSDVASAEEIAHALANAGLLVGENDPGEPLFSGDPEEEKRLRAETLQAARRVAYGQPVECLETVVFNLLAMYEGKIQP